MKKGEKMSQEQRDYLSELIKARWNDPDGRKNLSAALKEAHRKMRGRVAQFKSTRKHPNEAAASKWQILCMLSELRTCARAGERLNRSMSGTWQNARRMGLPNSLHDEFGEPFNGQAVDNLWKASGLTGAMFARVMGVPENVIYGFVNGRGAARGCRPGRRITAIRDSRQRLIRNLLSAAPKGNPYRYSASRVLKTFFPNLEAKCDLLREIMVRCRTFLRNNPNAGATELGEYLCAEAQRETATNDPAKLFARFLPWAPRIVPCFDLYRLRDGGLRPSRARSPARLAHEAVAKFWGTSWPIIYNADQHKTRFSSPFAPEEMRAFILHLNGKGKPANSAKATNKGGAPRKRDPRQLEEGIRLYPLLKSWGKVARKLDPEEFAKDPKGAADSFRLDVKYYRKHPQQSRPKPQERKPKAEVFSLTEANGLPHGTRENLS